MRKVSKAASTSRKILLLSPDPIHRLPVRVLLTIDTLRTSLAAAGHFLEVLVFFPKTEDTDSAVETLAAAEPTAIFLLYQRQGVARRETTVATTAF